jgi:predicted metal-dependent hydrolase
MINTFNDDVIGTISIRRNRLSRSIRMRLSPRGEIVVSAPMRTPMLLIKQAVRSARDELLSMQNQSNTTTYLDGDKIGQSHQLKVVRSTSVNSPTLKRSKNTLILTLAPSVEVGSPEIQTQIREQVVSILRREARAYLPKRLATLASRYDYSYQSLRLPHAIGRWGSCSSAGTISLNIGLMKLPLELIDYVILHELAHTKQMNHSKQFWQLVGQTDPDYQKHRRTLKTHSPII